VKNSAAGRGQEKGALKDIHCIVLFVQRVGTRPCLRSVTGERGWKR